MDPLINPDGSLSLSALESMAEQTEASKRQFGTSGLRRNGTGLDVAQTAFGTEFRLKVLEFIYVRLVGRGDAIGGELAAPLAIGATTATIGALTGTSLDGTAVQLPGLPCLATLSTGEPVTVTDASFFGSGYNLTLVRATGDDAATEDAPAGTGLAFLGTQPYAWNEVMPATNSGVMTDYQDGELGVVRDVEVTAAAAALFQAQLLDAVTTSSVDGETVYTGLRTTLPLYEINGIDAPADGTKIVKAWPSPTGDCFLFEYLGAQPNAGIVYVLEAEADPLPTGLYNGMLVRMTGSTPADSGNGGFGVHSFREVDDDVEILIASLNGVPLTSNTYYPAVYSGMIADPSGGVQRPLWVVRFEEVQYVQVLNMGAFDPAGPSPVELTYTPGSYTWSGEFAAYLTPGVICPTLPANQVTPPLGEDASFFSTLETWDEVWVVEGKGGHGSQIHVTNGFYTARFAGMFQGRPVYSVSTGMILVTGSSGSGSGSTSNRPTRKLTFGTGLLTDNGNTVPSQGGAADNVGVRVDPDVMAGGYSGSV